MYCISCGKETPAIQIKFCPYCGAAQPGLAAAIHDSSFDNKQLEAVSNETTTAGFLENFPHTDLEPIFFTSPCRHRVRHNDDTNPPQTWISGLVEVMYTDRYIFVLKVDAERKKNLARRTKFTSTLATAGLLTVVSVPIAGAVVVGLGAALIAGVDAFQNNQTRKHPGYGKNEQFRPEAIYDTFCEGYGLWADRKQCSFSMIRHKTGFLNPDEYYFVTTACFNHIDGVQDLAIMLVKEDNPRKILERECSPITITDGGAFDNAYALMKSIEGYPFPKIK